MAAMKPSERTPYSAIEDRPKHTVRTAVNKRSLIRKMGGSAGHRGQVNDLAAKLSALRHRHQER